MGTDRACLGWGEGARGLFLGGERLCILLVVVLVNNRQNSELYTSVNFTVFYALL